MKVLVLGAAGPVGKLVVRRAAEAGHAVTAFTRRGGATLAPPAGVAIATGDVLDADAMDAAVRGQEAVVYSVGSPPGKRVTLFSESTALLLDSMRRHGVRRLVCITGVGAGDTKGHGGFVYDRLVYPLFTKGMYEDKDRQEALIRGSETDWIIVRPAPFRESRTDAPLTVVTDVAGVTLRRISRDEVAKFVVEQLAGERYLRQTPFIGHPR